MNVQRNPAWQSIEELMIIIIASSLISVLIIFIMLHDIGVRTIPDWASLLIFLAGLGLRCADHHLLAGFVASAGLFALAAILWRFGLMGGGDVKLIGAEAMLLPPHEAVAFVILFHLLGGALAVIYAVLHRIVRLSATPGRPSLLPARLLRAERWRIARGPSLPYGVAIGLAGLILLLQGQV